MATLKAIVGGQLKKLGVTQKELAERAGLNPTYINELMTGKKLNIQRRFVESLAHALEIEPDVLYEKAGRTKKQPIESPTPRSTRRTIIRANSPETEALFPVELRAFQLDPNFDADKHVPLFVEPFPSDYRARIKMAGEVAKFQPFVWPEFLGPAKGCYAIEAAAIGANTLFADSVFLVAPGRGIKSGDIFVGEFCYMLGSAHLQVHRLLDATEREFILADIGDGREKRVPRSVITRFHKVVGLFERPD
jgi:transcriptional regulator with XRE-family HTH domain